MTSSRTPLRLFLLLILANILFGTTFAANKYLLSGHIGVFSLAFVRQTMAGLIVLCVVLWRRIPFPRGRDFFMSCLLGLLVHALALPIEYFGTRLSTASNVSLLAATEAAQCVVLASLLLREKISSRHLFGFLICLVGVVIVLWNDLRHAALLSAETFHGDLIFMCATILYALYTVTAKPLVARSHPQSIFVVACLFSSCLLSFFAVPGLIDHPPWEYSLRLWWWIFYLAVPCMAVPIVLWYSLLRVLSAGVTGGSLFLQPLIGVSCAWVFLGERPGGFFFLAGAMILAGLYITVRTQRPTGRSELPPRQ